MMNLNLQGGYNFKLLEEKIKFITICWFRYFTMYIKGSFDENLEYGYKGETETDNS